MCRGRPKTEKCELMLAKCFESIQAGKHGGTCALAHRPPVRHPAVPQRGGKPAGEPERPALGIRDTFFAFNSCWIRLTSRKAAWARQPAEQSQEPPSLQVRLLAASPTHLHVILTQQKPQRAALHLP